MKSLFTSLVLAAGLLLTLGNEVQAAVVSFGSGANQFNMEFVTIGNPGNAADTTGSPNPAGKVDYVYGIGKYEVNADTIDKYNANFGSFNSLAITKIGQGNKPATGVSWNEAARFVNWLNANTNNFVAYKFTTGGVNDNIALWDPILDPLDYDSSNPYRSKRATFVLPSYNEWYKAAYYDPSKSGGGGYWIYPTGSNTAPTPVASGTQAGTAVYAKGLAHGWPGPADVDQAGGLSPYGVMGLSGNVFEWEETSYSLTNHDGGLVRPYRGAYYGSFSEVSMASSGRFLGGAPTAESFDIGFRVAMVTPSGGQVPEPTSMAIFGLGALGMAYRAGRKAKA